MLKKTYVTIFIALLSLPLLADYPEVRFGPRPNIDLTTVSPEWVEPDRFRIRLTRETGNHLDQNPIIRQSGLVSFGLQNLDQLAANTGVIDVSATFSGPSVQTRYTDRHRLWGLHLWYDIHITDGQDILEVVQMFQNLKEVDVAEPVYLKQMVAGEVFDWDEELFITREEADGWIPEDPQFDNQWHYHNTGQTNGTPGADISLPAAWEIEKGDSIVLVAIIDDGIQFNHPDLEANMWDGIGFNFVNNSPNVVPGNHGTHVAGTVAAVSNNNVGVAGVAGGSGLGDGVRLMSAQVFQGNSSGGFANSFVWAADNDAAITQNSWGYTAAGVFEQAVLDAIDYFNANGGGEVLDGGLTIFAAGNSGDSGDYYPGFYVGAMSVASTNHNDQKSWYSTYGSWVDISAPGGETNNVNSQGVLSTVTGSGYAFYQGTSMACPHVSGVAALILSKAPGLFTNDEVWDMLVSSTDNHYGVNSGFIGQLGTGRLNAFNALMEVDNYLIGLINPSQFAAEATGTDRVDLSWALNPDNDPVLLTFSEDGFFGTPEGTYEPGDEITGGGTVLFFGQDNAFVHTDLETSTQYFYRIWSKKDGQYSSGRMVSATTWCDVFVLPFDENFDDNQLPLCWETFASSGGNWQVGSFSGGLNIDGSYAYSGSGFTGGQNADLISPILDMTMYDDVTISFQHYYRAPFLGGGSGSFHYSTDNGVTWQQVQSWTSNTQNPATFEVTIPELAGESTVRLRWNNSIGFIGYYWTVGEISITGELVEAPEIFVVDDPIIIELEEGDTDQVELMIANHGEVDLEIIEILVEYANENHSFMDVDPVSMTLSPGEEQHITIHFMATGMEEGQYHASVVILSNDPHNPVVTIPAVMNVFASTPETVVEIINDSEAHTILTTALEVSGLDSALAGEGPFTVFAPTDTAFNELPEGLLDDLLNDPEGALANVLLYHVVEAFALAGDLSDGQEITTMLGEDVLVTINEDGVFINDAEVMITDLIAENGVVHVIDAVLIPPVTTVVDIILDSDIHTVLAVALVAADLIDVLNSEGPFTVFAPVDAAFLDLPDGLLDDLLADPEGALTDVLLYHVVEGYVLANELFDGQEIPTLLGENLVVTINEEGVFINNAKVTLADLEADNGVVHVVDAVITEQEEDTTNIHEIAGSSDLNLLMYPNPARDLLNLEFTLQAPGDAVIEIYSLTGERLSQTLLGNLPAGVHTITEDISTLRSGLYITLLTTGSGTSATRLQIIR